MAKTSSTIYLEEKFWKLIKSYQDENNISSRNDAIQFILHEWMILNKVDFSKVSINVNGAMNVPIDSKQEVTTIDDDNEEKKEEKQIDPKIKNGFMKIAASMK